MRGIQLVPREFLRLYAAGGEDVRNLLKSGPLRALRAFAEAVEIGRKGRMRSVEDVLFDEDGLRPGAFSGQRGLKLSKIGIFMTLIG